MRGSSSGEQQKSGIINGEIGYKRQKTNNMKNNTNLLEQSHPGSRAEIHRC